MEAIPYGILFLLLLFLFAIGIWNFIKGFRFKNSKFFFIGFVFISIPFTAFYYQSILNFISPKLNQNEIIGKYKIVSSDNLIPQSDFDKYTLEFKKDGTFQFSPNSEINLCENGNYDVDYEFEANEISFQCGEGWSPAHLKRKLFGFEIEFFASDNSICFEKIQ